jgi:hypothetical protein
MTPPGALVSATSEWISDEQVNFWNSLNFVMVRRSLHSCHREPLLFRRGDLHLLLLINTEFLEFEYKTNF